MKCPKCNGNRMATYMSAVDWFVADSEQFESGTIEGPEDIRTCVSVGVNHCLDCGHEEFWLEDPRSPLEAENKRLRVACSAALECIRVGGGSWMLAELEPQLQGALEPQP